MAGTLANRDYSDEERRAWMLATIDGRDPMIRHCACYRFRIWLWANLYNYVVPFAKDKGLLALGLLKWALSIGHLFWPVAIGIYAKIEGFEKWQDLIYFAIFYVVVTWTVEVIHKFRERGHLEKLKDQSRNHGTIAFEKAVKALTQMLVPTSDSSKDDKRDLAKEEFANWAIQEMNRRLHAFWQSTVVNVFTFANAQCDTLKACVRTPKTHDTPQVHLPGSLLFWATRIGEPVNVPCSDFSWHPFDIGATKSRSKILVPITDRDENGEQFCLGVISLESAIPFRFHCRAGRDIDDIVLPLTSLVRLVIGTPKFKRKVDPR